MIGMNEGAMWMAHEGRLNQNAYGLSRLL